MHIASKNLNFEEEKRVCVIDFTLNIKQNCDKFKCMYCNKISIKY